MEEKPPRANLKRSFPEDDDSNKPSTQKRIRFPKGKKVKPGEEKVDVWKPSEDARITKNDPRHAAKERAMRRNQITTELFSEENRGMVHDITSVEVKYAEGETFVDDGILIEPFNLEQEREEGYFDEQGNFVEYIDNEIKDAWLDSVEVDTKLAQKVFTVTHDEDIDDDLSSEEIGKIKRRIADALEPGETVLQALRRLKGTSNNKKEKMSPETKLRFDQLTEDAMKLMENGDFNVYEEKQEVFEREAEGYEKLARAREEGISMDLGNNFVANGTNFGGPSSLLDTAVGPSNLNTPSEGVLPDGDDSLDMFAEDDESAAASANPDGGNLVSGPNHDRIGQPSESGSWESDYVYDEASGYYYSSSSGYYYDPSSGLYCSATSGQWYSYNEATGSYDEIQEAPLGISADGDYNASV
jgi:CD2 antigen cytoplasmic tail-binding protein 2